MTLKPLEDGNEKVIDMEQKLSMEHRMTEVEERSKSNTHRIDAVEKKQDNLDKLVGAVEILADREKRVEGDVKEIKDHGQNGRGTVKCFLVDVNREDEIHHWLVYVDILKNGEIWQIDAGKWVEKK